MKYKINSLSEIRKEKITKLFKIPCKTHVPGYEIVDAENLEELTKRVATWVCDLKLSEAQEYEPKTSR